MDGYVTIATRIDNKQLEKELNYAERQLQKYEHEAERLLKTQANVELDLTDYYERKDLIKQDTDEALMYKQTEEEVERELRNENWLLQQLEEKYADQLQKLSSVNTKLDENAVKQKLWKNEIEKTTQKAQGIGSAFNLGDVKGSIDAIGSKMENVIHKVTRWGLAIFGIRSAYRFVRIAISELTTTNSQLGADIEYIRWSLATSLQPVIETIVQYAYKLLVYINYISQAWFGVNIFAKASAKAFKQAKDSSAGTAKNTKAAADNAKELRKQLAGFDEMNILGDNIKEATSGGGGGAGGAGVDMPSFDLSEMEDVEIPDWLKWIAEHGSTIAKIIFAIGIALLTWKILDFLGVKAGSFKSGLSLMAGGIALLAGEVINLVLNWDNMTGREKAVSLALAAIGAAFIALGFAIQAGITAATLGTGALIALIIAVVAAAGTMIYKHEQEVKAAKSEEDQTKRLAEAKEAAKKAYDDLINAIDRQTHAEEELQRVEAETGLSGQALYEQVEAGTLTYKDMNETQRQVYKAYKELVDSTAAVEEAEKTKQKADKEEVTSEFAKKIAADKTGESYDQMKQDIITAWKDGTISTKQATDLMERMMGSMDTTTGRIFAKDIPDKIKKGLDENQYRGTMGVLENFFTNRAINIAAAFEKAVEKIKKWLNSLGFNGSVSVSASTSGGKKSAKGAIITYPKLAVGGIVSKPGTGIPIGGAIVGERGMEGVIPLTDSQQMALLGEAIGKYINVNATVPVYVGNRQIAREIRRINAEEDFAYNR